jgi:Mn2+/Fe2+ NRAMP family transporter
MSTDRELEDAAHGDEIIEAHDILMGGYFARLFSIGSIQPGAGQGCVCGWTLFILSELTK